jgi:hypothetical protein
MFTVNAKASEAIAILANYNAASVAASTVTTGWISAANHERFLAMISTGVLGASATLDAKLQQASDSSGTGAKDITGKAITQIVKASGDNKVALINLRASEVDVANGFTHFRLSMTVGTAASLLDAKVLGLVPRYEPSSASNIAAVVETV